MKYLITLLSLLSLSLSVAAAEMERVILMNDAVAQKMFFAQPDVKSEVSKLDKEKAGPYEVEVITSEKQGSRGLDAETASYQKHKVMFTNKNLDSQCSFTTYLIWRKLGKVLSIEDKSVTVSGPMRCY
jgi:hypothetical protein